MNSILREPYPVDSDGAEALPKPDARARRKRFIVLGGAVVLAASLAFVVTNHEQPSSSSHKSRQAEQTEVHEINRGGGQFYPGQLTLIDGGNVRTEPLIFSGERRSATPGNSISHPDNLTIVNPVVIKNDEGLWYGWDPKGQGEEATEDFVWAHSQAVDADEFVETLFVDFSVGDFPGSHSK